MTLRFLRQVKEDRGVFIEAAVIIPLLVLVIAVFTNIFFMFSNIGQIEEGVHEAIKYVAVVSTVDPLQTNSQILDKAKTRVEDFLKEKCNRCKSYSVAVSEAPYAAPMSGTEATVQATVTYEVIPWLSGPSDLEITLSSKGVLRP